MREPIVLKSNSSLDEKLNKLRYSFFVNRNDKYMLKAGIAGEKQVEYHLTKSNIGMYIMRDINLEIDNLKCQIDFVVVTSHHCYFIECKNYSADIVHIDANRNFEISKRIGRRYRRQGIKSPLSQVEDQLSVFQRMYLKDEDIAKNILNGIKFEDYFKTIVVFTNPNCRLNSEKAPYDIKYRILKVDNLIRQIEYDENHNINNNLSDNQMSELANYFLKINRDIVLDSTSKNVEYINSSNYLKKPIKTSDIVMISVAVFVLILFLVVLFGNNKKKSDSNNVQGTYYPMSNEDSMAIEKLKDAYDSSIENGFDLYNYKYCMNLKKYLPGTFTCNGLPMQVNFVDFTTITLYKNNVCYYLKYNLTDKKIYGSGTLPYDKSKCSGIDIGLIQYDSSNKYLEKIGGYEKVLEMARFAHNYTSGFDNFYDFSKISKRGGNPNMKSTYKDQVDAYFGTISNKGRLRLNNTLEDFNKTVEYYYYIMK